MLTYSLPIENWDRQAYSVGDKKPICHGLLFIIINDMGCFFI